MHKCKLGNCATCTICPKPIANKVSFKAAVRANEAQRKSRQSRKTPKPTQKDT